MLISVKIAIILKDLKIKKATEIFSCFFGII